jgi:hypothetical protein
MNKTNEFLLYTLCGIFTGASMVLGYEAIRLAFWLYDRSGDRIILP